MKVSSLQIQQSIVTSAEQLGIYGAELFDEEIVAGSKLFGNTEDTKNNTETVCNKDTNLAEEESWQSAKSQEGFPSVSVSKYWDKELFRIERLFSFSTLTRAMSAFRLNPTPAALHCHPRGG